MHVNVSRGVKPVQVPGVVGEPYEQAAGELQGQNFAVKRTDVDSDQPKGTVVAQDPGANAVVTPGSTVTLSVSKGPTTTSVPDVTSSDQDTATSTLENSGFKVKVQKQPTTDPSQDGIVLDQDPVGGTNAKPGSTVTIFVGDASGAADYNNNSMTSRVRVAVLMGGRSSEHPVSLASAASVLEALDPERYEALPVKVGRDGRWELGPSNGHGGADGRRAGRDAAGADPRRAAGRALGRRRRAPDPPRAVRRGRHRAGAARARGRPVRRRRACSPRRSAWTRTASRR